MNCLECRRLTLVDPNEPDPAREKHLAGCPSCATFSGQMQRQDALIREAAQVEVPQGLAARVLLNQSLQPASRRPTQGFWLGLAASMLLAAALIPSLIDNGFKPTLEQQLIAHIAKHDVLTGFEHEHVSSPDKIEEVLASAHTAMPGEIGNILYASTCIVDGETMAHLLVKNGEEEFVVFVMPQRAVVERAFTQDDWTGLLASNGERSFAVINRNGRGLDVAVTQFSAQFGKAI